MKAPIRLHHKWLEGIKKEILQKKNSWQDCFFETIYLGGGTPSILSSSILEELLTFLNETFEGLGIGRDSRLQELNLEINPEHVSREKIDSWLALGFTRFSIGIQSFDDAVLERLGRSHSSKLAENALSLLSEYQLNFSADLMFGLPNQTVELFLKDLEKLCSYGPSHLSFYGLTIEEGTLFSQWESEEKVEFPEEYDEFYLKGVQLIESKGYRRYEVSNFSRPGYESKHNSLYWNEVDYLGLGPGAHTLQNGVRQGNLKHMNKWLAQMEGEEEIAESIEVLSEYDKISEMIWLGLRQSKGVDLTVLSQAQSFDILKRAQKYLDNSMLKYSKGVLRVQEKGWLLIDQMVVDLI
jgi:oxygen-independent coproporphyrinogen III oxidase